MPDMFNRDTTVGNPYSAEAAKLEFKSSGADVNNPLLVTQLNIQYAQQITRLWELGSNAQYFVAGRTQGNLTMSSVIGPKRTSTEFFTKFGDVCLVQTNNVIFVLGKACTSVNGSYSAKVTTRGNVLTNVAFRVQSQDMVVNQDVTAMFAACDVDDTGADADDNQASYTG